MIMYKNQVSFSQHPIAASLQPQYPMICLAGPTASGKTDLALALAASLPIEIISVDSAMVYRGLNIGTAKPSADVLLRVPHHLIDICDPTESYSAAHFCDDVAALVPQILARGRIPLLVGGTMMYFHALLNGLSPLPPADASVRAAITAEALQYGWDALHQTLAKVDPEAAAKIHPHDPQRLQRALEVYRITGQPLSVWQNQKPTQPWQALTLALVPQDRQVLHQRIDARFDAMLAQGFVDEVRHLRQQYGVSELPQEVSLHTQATLHADLPAMRSVGYRQAWQYLDNALSYEQFVLDAKTATRQLAKRQLTWLRHQFTGAVYLDAQQPDVLTNLETTIQTWLATIPTSVNLRQNP